MSFWGVFANFGSIFTIIIELYMFDRSIDVPVKSYGEIDVFLC